ncbi:hypothetical protein Q5P01_013242 [Channa striata]|uniref:Tissue factor pathway inhibitor n=1 Tax=Channa striata TaxID=64152 RepID=A0AA88SHJ4_CHASR|nr:hypothetical protein Q5P01_013242 [Channa striata]
MCVAVLLLGAARLGSSRRLRQANGAPPERYIFNELCALKDEPGPCKAIKERFFFNVDSGKCELFEYGGCGGNANNFESLEECEEKCVVSDDKDPCHLPEAPGPCRGLVTRYFFHNETQQCKHFFYGGCFGNANNFRNMAECQAKCQSPAKPSTVPEVHTQPAGQPASPTFLPGRLTQFQLGKQLNDTNQVPGEPQVKAVCFSPVDRGTCTGGEKRFAYNPETRRCQQFLYSGCGGNGNNFLSRKRCFRKCIALRRAPGLIRIKRKNLPNFVQPSA